MNTFPSTTSEGLAANKPSIPPPYKYKSEFDALRSMGFPSRQIVSVLDSSEGNIDVAVAMLLSQHAQEVPDIPDEETVTQTITPQPALQRMFAAASAAPPPQSASDSHEYTQVERKIAGKKPRNVYADILDLLIDYPDGIVGAQLKPYFHQKYGRKLLIPEGESLSKWMRAIAGVSVAPWKEGSNTIFFYDVSVEVEPSPTKQQNKMQTKQQNKMDRWQTRDNSRPDDWYCSGCDSMNFEMRTSCYCCHQEKGDDENKTKKKKEKNPPIVEKASDMKAMTTFKTKQCTNAMCFANLAKYGPSCPFWHTDADRRRNPFVVSYAPIACEFIQSNGSKVKNTHNTCVNGEACGFTHNHFEALYHPKSYKKTPCRFRGPLNGI